MNKKWENMLLQNSQNGSFCKWIVLDLIDYLQAKSKVQHFEAGSYAMIEACLNKVPTKEKVTLTDGQLMVRICSFQPHPIKNS
ncbi:hypothetical protein T08_4164 [Trichinella sp. T8]|nr:hypothetical protein T08_4164 [Trichinella sp. T8]